MVLAAAALCLAPMQWHFTCLKLLFCKETYGSMTTTES